MREKLIELMQAAHDDFYDHFEPGKPYWETIVDHLFANGVTVHIKKDKPPTDLTGKCGSCVYAKSGIHYGASLCYVECTNEDLLKSRPNRGKASAIRARTNKGCKRHTPRED